VDNLGLVKALKAGNTTITYTITGGCNNTAGLSANLPVTVYPDASLTNVSGKSSLCINDTVTFTNDGVLGGNGTGVWTSSDPTVATVDNLGQVKALKAGNTTITYTITGGCNNTAGLSANLPVTVYPDASLTNVSGKSPLCITETVTFTNDGVLGGNGTGTWTSSDPTVATVDNLALVKALKAGNTTITYTITGGCNNPAGLSASLPVTVYPDASLTNVSGKSPLCINDTVTFTNDGVLGGNGTGAWTSSDPTIATVDINGLVTAHQVGNANINYTITGGCNNPNGLTASYPVLVRSDVSLTSVVGKSPICIGDTAQYTNDGNLGSSGVGSWTSSDNNIATVDNNGLVRAVAAGKVTITYSISGGCGFVSKSASLDVNPDNTASQASSIESPCVNAIMNVITHNTTGATAITNDGIIGANGLPPGVSASWKNDVITISGQPSSSGTFKYSIPLIGGCGTAYATGTINVIALPSMPVGLDSAKYCEKDDSLSIQKLTDDTKLTGNIVWYDSSTGGNVVPSITPLTLGCIDYYAAVIVNGCESPNRKKVTSCVYPNPIITTQPLPKDSVHVGDPVKPLTVAYSSGSGSATYQWFSNTVPSYQGAQPTDSINASYIPSSASPGTFYFYCVVTMTDGKCSAVSNLAELIVIANGITVTADTTILKCPHDDNGQITLHITGGNPYTRGRAPYNITWKGPNGQVINDGTSKVSSSARVMRAGSIVVYDRTLSNLKAGVYEVTISDSIPTVVVKRYTISEPAEINIKVTGKKPSLAKKQYGEISAEVTGGTPPYSITWKLNQDTRPETGLLLTNLGPGTYEIIVTDCNNCPAVSAKYKIDEDLAVNTFTPNGDGTNDLFMENFFLQVFNRNGIMLYEGTSGWDGTFNNQPMQDDTYMYVVKYKSDSEIEYKTGYVTLVR
jgi:gliding motility-associated-like protein